MTLKAAALEKSWAVAFLRSAALPQHMAERLCLSGGVSFCSRGYASVIGGVASWFLGLMQTVRRSLTAMCCGRAAFAFHGSSNENSRH